MGWNSFSTLKLQSMLAKWAPERWVIIVEYLLNMVRMSSGSHSLHLLNWLVINDVWDSCMVMLNICKYFIWHYNNHVFSAGVYMRKWSYQDAEKKPIDNVKYAVFLKFISVDQFFKLHSDCGLLLRWSNFIHSIDYISCYMNYIEMTSLGHW